MDFIFKRLCHLKFWKWPSTPSFPHCFAFLPYCIKVIRILSAVESFTEMRAQGWRWRPALFWQVPFTESRIWNRNPRGFELLWSSPSTITSLQLFLVFPILSPYKFHNLIVFLVWTTTWVRHVPMCVGLQASTEGWATYLQPHPQGHGLFVPHNSSRLPTVPQTGVGNLGVPPLSTLEFWFQFYFYFANIFRIMIYVKL